MSTFQPNHLRTISQQRRLQVGVILLGGTTEILDIAPVDVLTAMSKDAISIFPPEVVAEELKKQAVAVDMHYVNESGKPARVTSGMSLNVTVCPACFRLPFSFLYSMPAQQSYYPVLSRPFTYSTMGCPTRLSPKLRTTSQTIPTLPYSMPTSNTTI